MAEKCGVCGSVERRVDGRCAPCRRSQERQYYKKNKGRCSASMNAWRERNKEKLNEGRRDWYQKFRSTVRGKATEAYRDASRKKCPYACSKDELIAWLEQRKHIKHCELCGKPTQFQALCIDHTHDTGLPRWLLCHRCNLCMRAVDDVEFIRCLFDKAPELLLKHQPRKVRRH